MKNVTHAPSPVLLRPLSSAAAVLFAALREIFDEAAYARFLARHSATRSRQSYAAFLREIGFQRERRARCC